MVMMGAANSFCFFLCRSPECLLLLLLLLLSCVLLPALLVERPGHCLPRRPPGLGASSRRSTLLPLFLVIISSSTCSSRAPKSAAATKPDAGPQPILLRSGHSI